jgi:hypothetical protein
MSHTLTVRLDERMIARLEKAAARVNQPVSTLVRQVVADWLDQVGPRHATTLLTAAGSLSGSGLPATNQNVRASFQRRRK